MLQINIAPVSVAGKGKALPILSSQKFYMPLILGPEGRWEEVIYYFTFLLKESPAEEVNPYTQC